MTVLCLVLLATGCMHAGLAGNAESHQPTTPRELAAPATSAPHVNGVGWDSAGSGAETHGPATSQGTAIVDGDAFAVVPTGYASPTPLLSAGSGTSVDNGPTAPLDQHVGAAGQVSTAAVQHSAKYVEGEQATAPSTGAEPVAPGHRRQLPGALAEHAQVVEYPIDLGTALRLGDANNLQAAAAQERMREAIASLAGAEVLWLPSLRAGVNYNKHEGAIQDVAGTSFDTSRGGLYSGLGAGAVGAGSPAYPGLSAVFHLSDAIFRPLAAQQRVSALERASQATSNAVLRDVALAYLELLRGAEGIEIALESRQDAAQLAALTADFARTGAGLQADAERAATELVFRENDVRRAIEAYRVASARLAELIRLEPTLVLVPIEPAVAPLHLVASETSLGELVAQGLTRRPELSQNRYLVGEAAERLRQQQCAPFLPSIVLGTSYGGFGAGEGSTIAGYGDRLDVDAVAYWELRNLGFGEAAARGEARSQLRGARLELMVQMDRVARQVVEAHAQVEERRVQIETARRGIELALASYQRNLERVRNAQGLPLEALQSIQALAQARNEYLRAVIDHNTAQFSLLYAIGWPTTLE